MEVPISVALLLVLVLAVFSLAVIVILPYLAPSNPPVTMNVPSGQPVYKVGDFYYIPVRVSMSENSPPIRVCRVNIRYVDPLGALRSEHVDLLWVRDGEPATFTGGSITFQKLTLDKPMSQTIVVRINQSSQGTARLVSIYVYYCVAGESSPRWGEELVIPDRPLS